MTTRTLVALGLALSVSCGGRESGPKGHDHDGDHHPDPESPVAQAAQDQGPNRDHEEGASGEAEHGEEPGTTAPHHFRPLHLEPALARAWELETGRPGYTDILGEVELPGVLTTNQNRTARVGPLVAGQVGEVLADLGHRVRAGQLLATLNAPEFTRARSDFLRAFARAELARQEYERGQALREEEAIEERELLRRRARMEEQVAVLRSAEVLLHSMGLEEEEISRFIQAGLDLSRPLQDHSSTDGLMPLKAPIDGVVLERNAIRGSHVEPGHTLFTLSDLTSLWARLDAYEDQLAALSPQAQIILRTPLIPDREFPGRITFIADQVDPELRTVRVRVEVPNPEGLLRPNMFVSGFLTLRGEEEGRMVVPPGAVQSLEGHQVVFVEDPREEGEEHRVFRPVEVTPGEVTSRGRVILAGLEGSEMVVVRGAFSLKAELTKGATGHSHAH